jgi:hypothetical protein
MPTSSSFNFTTDLIADGGSLGTAIDVGDVLYSYDDFTKELTVTYQIVDSTPGDLRDDWFIRIAHFDYSINDLSGIPTNKPGNPQIGKFDYQSDFLPFDGSGGTTEYSFTVNVGDLEPGDVINLAAHAVVSQLGGLEALEYALPEQVTMSIVDYPSAGDNSYFDTQITSSEATWLNGIYDGWCVDTGRTIGLNTNYTANVHSSYEDLTGIVDKPNNLDAVNWLINNFEVGDSLYNWVNYGGEVASPSDYLNDGSLVETPTTNPDPLIGLGPITYGDIQRAIWGLIDNTQSTSGVGSFSNARADELADRAYLHVYENGEFIPECGDTVALVLQPVNASGGTNAQVTIAQVTLAELGIPCEGGEETAWGEGAYDAYNGIGDQNNPDVLGGTFTDSSWAMYSQFAIPNSGDTTVV